MQRINAYNLCCTHTHTHITHNHSLTKTKRKSRECIKTKQMRILTSMCYSVRNDEEREKAKRKLRVSRRNVDRAFSWKPLYGRKVGAHFDIGIGLDDSTDKNDDAVFLLFVGATIKINDFHFIPSHWRSAVCTAHTHTHTRAKTYKITQTNPTFNDYDNSVHAPHMDGMSIFKQKW